MTNFTRSPWKTGSCEWKNGPIPENPPPLHQKSKKFKTIFGDKGDVLTKFWPKKNDPKLPSQGDKEFTMSRCQRHQKNL